VFPGGDGYRTRATLILMTIYLYATTTFAPLGTRPADVLDSRASHRRWSPPGRGHEVDDDDEEPSVALSERRAVDQTAAREVAAAYLTAGETSGTRFTVAAFAELVTETDNSSAGHVARSRPMRCGVLHDMREPYR